MSRDPFSIDLATGTGFSPESFKGMDLLRTEREGKRAPRKGRALREAAEATNAERSHREISLSAGAATAAVRVALAKGAEQIQQQSVKEFAARIASLRTAARTSVSSLLKAAEVQSDPEQIGKLAHDLTEKASRPEDRAQLQLWLSNGASAWVRDRRPALAAVIETGARLGLPETLQVAISVLKDDAAHSTVASVAAQRIRLLPVDDRALAAEIGTFLQRRIDTWLTARDTRWLALLALPSAARFSWRTGSDWLAAHFASDDDETTWAISQGLLDVAAGPIPGVDEDFAKRFFQLALTRLDAILTRPEVLRDPANPDVSATLIWVLAALCTQNTIEATARLLARIFNAPRGLQAPASVRAGRLFVQRWRDPGMTALLDAFGDPRSPNCIRYLALLPTGR